MNKNTPLEGIKILDVSTMIAAPYGAVLLGDFGAEVIKVEIPEKGIHCGMLALLQMVNL